MAAPLSDGTAPSGVGVLLAVLGRVAQDDLASRLDAIGLTPPQAAVLRAVAAQQGRSQQSLSEQLVMQPSRVVVHVDALQRSGWLERRRKKDDRRLYALYLTPAGAGLIRQLERTDHDHERAITAALSVEQAARLRDLLSAVAIARGEPLQADDRAPVNE